ncbi:MAG: sigma-70 family RNA polymerase sigma factor [Phycisphaerales bacterium]|nr:MAG: sigma-70 family RNA polymerase sigma factor [Phycisphaerales bacterium]
MTEKEAIYCGLLVLRCRRGQGEALEELVQKWEKPLLYYIRRHVDDEHEPVQILQRTWVKVLQGLRNLREPRRLAAWLYSIARKTALSRLRARYSEQVLFENNIAIEDYCDADAGAIFDDAEQIHYGLNKLSLIHREILTLFFLQDLSLEEIAGVLEIPVGTVKSRLHHAKRMLKTVLEQEESSHG